MKKRAWGREAHQLAKPLHRQVFASYQDGSKRGEVERAEISATQQHLEHARHRIDER